MAGVTESVHKGRAATARERRVSDSLSSPNPSSDLHLEFCDLFCRIGQVPAGSVQSASIQKIVAGCWLLVAGSVSLGTHHSMPAASYKPGAVAQLGERLICIQEVAGSIPTSSTSVGLGPVAQLARAHP